MTDTRGQTLRKIIDDKKLWNEPLFCDVIESYLCIKKHKGRFEVVHDNASIRVVAKWTGAEITRKLLG